MKAIVTVRLPRNPKHNPRNKIQGTCPVSCKFCSDTTGEHHSFLMEGSDLAEIYRSAIAMWDHITRIEEV